MPKERQSKYFWPASAITYDLISLGHKKLLPSDALKAFALIESRAHALVDANTFPFLGGIARFPLSLVLFS